MLVHGLTAQNTSMNDIEQLKQRIDTLERFILSLQASSTIPLEVNRALLDNLQIAQAQPSTKSTGSSQTVVSGTPVAKPMDGFIQITVNGNIRTIPYYN